MILRLASSLQMEDNSYWTPTPGGGGRIRNVMVSSISEKIKTSSKNLSHLFMK